MSYARTRHAVNPLVGLLRRAGGSSGTISTDVFRSTIPRMVISKYPEEIKLWRDVNSQDRVACLQVWNQMIDDFGKLPLNVEGENPLGEWFREVVEFDVSLWLPLTVYYARQIKGDSITSDELFKARVLTNLMHLTVSTQFIVDDMLDGGEVRNGRECWHRKVGSRAIIDVPCLALAEVELARIYFADSRFFHKIIESISRCNLGLYKGQMKDSESEERRPATSDDTGIKWELYTPENYRTMAYFKASPITERIMTAALHFCDIEDKQTHSKAVEIVDTAGELFQVTNDWWDWAHWDHSDVHKNGERGKDCRLGKPTWSAITAWARANDSQRSVLRKYYGVDDDEAVDRVITLFKELGLPEKHKEYEERALERMFSMIDQWDSRKTGVPRHMLPASLTTIFYHYNVDDLASFATAK